MRGINTGSASFGFIMTVSLPAVVGGLQFLLAPEIVRATVVGVLEAEVSAYAREFRHSLIPFYLCVFAGIAAYWVIFAFRTSSPRANRAADLTLLFAGIWFAVAMVIFSTVPQPIFLLKPGCTLLGIPDTTSVYGLDTRSECEAFLFRYGQFAFLGIPIALMVVSAALRVFSSRSRRVTNGS